MLLGQHLPGGQGLQGLTGGMGRAELHPRQGPGQLGAAGFHRESRSLGTSVVERQVQGQASLKASVHEGQGRP